MKKAHISRAPLLQCRRSVSRASLPNITLIKEKDSKTQTGIKNLMTLRYSSRTPPARVANAMGDHSIALRVATRFSQDSEGSIDACRQLVIAVAPLNADSACSCWIGARAKKSQVYAKENRLSKISGPGHRVVAKG